MRFLAETTSQSHREGLEGLEEIEREYYYYNAFKALARATTGFEPYQLFDGNWSVCHVLVTALHDFPSLIRSRFRNDYTVVNGQSDNSHP